MVGALVAASAAVPATARAEEYACLAQAGIGTRTVAVKTRGATCPSSSARAAAYSPRPTGVTDGWTTALETSVGPRPPASKGEAGGYAEASVDRFVARVGPVTIEARGLYANHHSTCRGGGGGEAEVASLKINGVPVSTGSNAPIDLAANYRLWPTYTVTYGTTVERRILYLERPGYPEPKESAILIRIEKSGLC